MPQPTGWRWVATSATATGTTSLSIALPTGTVDDDILHMFLSHRGAGFATVPVGWTLIDQDVTAGGLRGEWYWKRASGEAGPYSVTDLANSAVGYIVATRGGLLTGDVVDASVSRVNLSGASGTAALTTTVANTLVIMFTAQGPSLSGMTMGVRHGATSPNLTVSLDPELSSMQSFGAATNTTGDDAALNAGRGFKAVPGTTIDEFRRITGGNAADNVCIVAAFKPETGGATSGTRYYLTPHVPVAPRREPWPPEGDWSDTFLDGKISKSIVLASMLSQQYDTMGFFPHNVAAGSQLATNQEGDFDAFYRRFLTPPLQAQTLAGTFQCTLGLNARWKNTLGTLSNDTVARLKVHAYVTVGQTAAVRQVIIDNEVDAANINNANNNIVWTGLSAPVSVAGAAIQAGDSIAIEIGIRIVSSPTPAPSYPPTEWSQISLFAVGTPLLSTAAADDGVIGNTAAIPQTECAHFDFTDTILEQSWVPASPTNISPATATDITTTPFSEIASPYNTHGSTANARAVWYTHTATRTGTLIITARGTMGYVNLTSFTGATLAYADLNASSDSLTFQEQSNQRCLTIQALPVVEGTTYYIRVNGQKILGYAGLSAVASLSVAYQEAPASGDKFLPNGIITVFRDHAMVNFNQDFESFGPTGCAIDYTQRPLDDGSGENTNYRLYVALFSSALVEILDLTTLNRDTTEIDFINAPWELASGRTTTHFGALHLTRNGELYAQAMGNGFLYVIGFATGTPADLTNHSDNADVGYVRGIDATHADNQPGNPWPLASELAADREQTAPWHGGLNETTSVLYYDSGGLYVTLPVTFPTTTGDGQIAKRFNVVSDAQGADLVTLAAAGTNQGLKGMCVHTDGSVFITNGSQLRLVNGDTGAIIQTYTPTSDYPVSLIDVKLEPDGLHVSCIDQNTIDIFTFEIATAIQTDRIRTWGAPQFLTQFAIFAPEGVPEPFSIETEVRPIRRLRQSPHVSANGNRVWHEMLQVDLRPGIGLTTGQGSNPLVILQTSRDGGFTWSNERFASAGALGQYLKRVMFWRNGMGRDVVYRIVVSDPVAWDVVGAYLKVSEGLD